jgi:hypothetical protein
MTISLTSITFWAIPDQGQSQAFVPAANEERATSATPEHVVMHLGTFGPSPADACT